MSRETILIVLGVLVLVSPWSGLPLSWLEWVLAVIGLAVIGIGYSMRSHSQGTPTEPLHSTQDPEIVPSTVEPRSRSSRIALS